MEKVEITHSPLSAAAPTRVKQIRDYCDAGMNLFWQRQMSFVAALGLSAFYYHLWLTLVTFGLIVASELYDYTLFRRISAWQGRSRRVLSRFMLEIYLSTILSASIISFYAVSIALEQGPTTHFMPLFMLFAAALFASMNNHQLLSVLTLRLFIYGATFMFIPVFDILRTGAEIRSELFMQLFTVVFVVYFIIDCSRVFLKMYRDNVRQMDELRIEHEKTKVAYVAKTEFISTISHELRTPMTSIKGSLDMVCAGAMGKLPEKAERALLIAQRNSARLTSIINELLDLQKFEAGRVEMTPTELDLGDVVLDAVALNQSYSAKFGVVVEVDKVDADVTILADEQRLQQVMSNVLSNAAKFSHEGSEVRIRTEVCGRMARILVRDNGIGLTEEDRVKVFEEFSQVDSSDQRRVDGSGLGMNISKRIMEALGGGIDYRKNDGPGTTFFIDIPIVESDSVAFQYPTHGDADQHGEQGNKDRGRNMVEAA